MAIDTQTKRRSVLGYTLGLALVLPVADGSIVAGDRAHVAGLYSGLALIAPQPPRHLDGPFHTGPRFVGDVHTGPRWEGPTQTGPRWSGPMHE